MSHVERKAGPPLPRGRCDSGKVSFGSRSAATSSRSSHRNKGRKMRAYFCPRCRYWHLSSEAYAA